MRPTPGPVLIVGSRVYEGREDRRALHENVLGVDMLAGDGVDVVFNMEDRKARKVLGTFAHVECMSVLEHTLRPWLVAANIERCMKDGASLFVTVPFVWRVHGYPSDYWRMTPEGVRALFPAIAWEEVELAHRSLGGKLRALQIGRTPYFPRTEVCGFGIKRCVS